METKSFKLTDFERQLLEVLADQRLGSTIKSELVRKALDRIDELEKQHDELVDALEEAIKFMQAPPSPKDAHIDYFQRKLDIEQTLTRAKGDNND